MTEFWKSTAKHYCKLCNVWTSANPHNVRLHEQGASHREKQREDFKKKESKKRDESKAQREMQAELRALEKTALASFKDDVQAGVAKLGPRTLHSSYLAGPHGFKGPPGSGRGGPAAAAAADAVVEDNNGYEADGYTRLDGTVDYVKYYNILYGHGDDAPAASAAAAGGAPPTAGAAVVSGAGVNGAALSTDVSTAGSEARAAKRVRPADGAEASADTDEPADPVKADAPPDPELDASTGMGVWTTVSVNEVKARERKEAELKRKFAAKEAKLKQDADAAMDDGSDSDTAADLGYIDPRALSAKKAKVKHAEEESTVKDEADEAAGAVAAGTISFKKKGAAAKPKQLRTKKINWD